MPSLQGKCADDSPSRCSQALGPCPPSEAIPLIRRPWLIRSPSGNLAMRGESDLQVHLYVYLSAYSTSSRRSVCREWLISAGAEANACSFSCSPSYLLRTSNHREEILVIVRLDHSFQYNHNGTNVYGGAFHSRSGPEICLGRSAIRPSDHPPVGNQA